VRFDQESAALAHERAFPPAVLFWINEEVADKCPDGPGRKQLEVSGREQTHWPRKFPAADKRQEREKSEESENDRTAVGEFPGQPQHRRQAALARSSVPSEAQTVRVPQEGSPDSTSRLIQTSGMDQRQFLEVARIAARTNHGTPNLRRAPAVPNLPERQTELASSGRNSEHAEFHPPKIPSHSVYAAETRLVPTSLQGRISVTPLL
jgi:hypothetical protein